MRSGEVAGLNSEPVGSSIDIALGESQGQVRENSLGAEGGSPTHQAAN